MYILVSFKLLIKITSYQDNNWNGTISWLQNVTHKIMFETMKLEFIQTAELYIMVALVFN